MPRNRRLCPAPGCNNSAGSCPRHNHAPRVSAAKLGYTGEHVTRFRAAVLDRDPVCVVCGKKPSKIADHWPMSRKWLVREGLDPNNPAYGRGLCWSCHSRETGRNQPGGFAAPR